jgi:hypothetical protein
VTRAAPYERVKSEKERWGNNRMSVSSTDPERAFYKLTDRVNQVFGPTPFEAADVERPSNNRVVAD